MAEFNYQGYSSNIFRLDFSQDTIPTRFRSEETINLNFNGYQYSFDSIQESIGWTIGFKELEFSFNFQSPQLEVEIDFVNQEFSSQKLRYIWGTTILLSFFFLISSFNYSSALKAPENRPFKALSLLALSEKNIEEKHKDPVEKKDISIFINNTSPISTPIKEEKTKLALLPATQNQNQKNEIAAPARQHSSEVAVEGKKILPIGQNAAPREKRSKSLGKAKSHSLPTSLEAPFSKALKEKKLVIIGFGAKWCLPCKLMEESTFKDEAVKEFLEQHYSLLKIDVDDFDGFNLKQHFEVNLLPTFIVLNEKGKIKSRYEESLSAKKMLNVLVQNKANWDMFYPEPVVTSTKTNGELEQKPLSIPSVEILDVSLQKSRNGKMISKLRANGRNWNYTSVQFQLGPEFTDLNHGKEIVVKIINTDQQEPFAQLVLKSYTISNRIQIAHPWQKKLAENYAIQIFIKNSDGSLSQLINGSKPIIANYDPTM